MNRTSTIRALAVGALLASSAGFAQAQGVRASDAAITAAKAEGGFMLYASISEPQIKALLAGFEKDYGIKGEFLRLVSTPLIQRFSAANDGNSNDADAFLDSSPQVFELHPQWFVKLDAKEVPNVARWPSRWVGATSVTVQTSGSVVQFNTDLVKEADIPKTWGDLADPKWKGRILLTDPRVSDTYLGWVDMLEKRYGAAFIQKLGAQDIKLTQSGASGAQLVAAGSSHVNFPAYSSFSAPLIEKKAPISYRVMKDPVLASQTSLAAVAKAPHPKTARLFVDWVLSESAVRALCAALPVSTPGDETGKLGCVALKDPQPLPWRTTPERRAQLLKLLGL